MESLKTLTKARLTNLHLPTHHFLQTDRFIEVDFNSLDTTVNLQTWVVFLEFFGIGRAPEEATLTQQPEAMNIDGESTGTYICLLSQNEVDWLQIS